MCQIGSNEERLHFACYRFLGHGVERMLSIHILCHYIPHLRWQTLWLHIIWVISLYFYAADVSPCQQAPWQSKMENPPSFKVLHMSLPSLLSFPLPTPTFRDPKGHRPCVQSWWWENAILIDGPKWKSRLEWHTGNKRQLVIVFFFVAVGLMTHLSSNMDWDPGSPSERPVKDTNGRWLIGNWGKWLLWYWYHHWCNVIEMAMTHNHILAAYIILHEAEYWVQNRGESWKNPRNCSFILVLVLTYWNIVFCWEWLDIKFASILLRKNNLNINF